MEFLEYTDQLGMAYLGLVILLGIVQSVLIHKYSASDTEKTKRTLRKIINNLNDLLIMMFMLNLVVYALEFMVLGIKITTIYSIVAHSVALGFVVLNDSRIKRSPGLARAV